MSPDALLTASENRRMFDQIAWRYDRLNHLMSLGLHWHWRRRAIDALLAAGGRRFLDLGCGTGDVALELAGRAPAAAVVGLDCSREMLALARRKAHAAGLAGRVSFPEGDALRLPLAAAEFDGAITAFCLRNLTDHARALKEMRRVLRPGGTAVILELTRPGNPLLAALHRIYIRRAVPWLGRWLSRGNAYEYLVASIESFPASERIVAAMEIAGFREARSRPLTCGTVTLFIGQVPRGGAA